MQSSTDHSNGYWNVLVIVCDYSCEKLYLMACIILQDLGKFGIAPKVIATKENFASSERERKRKADLSSSVAAENVITGAESVLVDLVMPKKYVFFVSLLSLKSLHIDLTTVVAWCSG